MERKVSRRWMPYCSGMALRTILIAVLSVLLTILAGAALAWHSGSCSDDGRVVGKGSCYYQGN